MMLLETYSLYLVVNTLIMIIDQEIKLSTFIANAVIKQQVTIHTRWKGIDLTYEKQYSLIKNGLNIF